MRLTAIAVLFLSSALLYATPNAFGNCPGSQLDLPPFETVEYPLDSGNYAGQGENFVLGFNDEIIVPGSIWIRLHFSDYRLGESSYLIISSDQDGGTQRLDSRTIEQWQGSSAFFNGDSLKIALYVAPGDTDVFFKVSRVTAGQPVGPFFEPKSLCDGDDDRVPYSDSRVGRILVGGCTAYLVSNGAVLTAGHCVDFDPDGNGNGVPDGILDLSGVVEFDVPASTAAGNPVMANPEDQYPIDTASVEWNFEGENHGLGKDWAIFSVFPNANNGDVAHVTKGFFRVTREVPGIDGTIRITGYGADSEATRNKVEQTDTGPYKGESSSGDDIWHKHRVDTRGASSGSPIIWNAYNIAIGIHTNAGCEAEGGTNAGTSFEHNPLETALDDFPGSSTVYVDRGMPAIATENGTVFRPYNTVAEGVTAVSTYGRLSLVEGYYDETLVIDKAMTLVAPVGTVIIGQ